MNTREMILRKNRLLKDAGRAMEEVWDIAMMLERVDASGRDYKTLVRVTAKRLSVLALSHDEMIIEADIALPEAEEEIVLPLSEIDENDLEEDLPFVVPSEEVTEDD